MNEALHTTRARPVNAIGIGLVAASVLCYQIVLMRTFALESYASFGAMVISVALLGFGLSGTLLTVFREWFLTRRDSVLFATAWMSVPLLVIAHFCQQAVPFVPGKMIADPDHAWWLMAYYGIALVPMLTQSFFIGVTLVGFTRDVHKLYFADLAASGIGAFAVLGLLYVVPPDRTLLLPVVPVGVAAILLASSAIWRALSGATLAGAVAVIAVYGVIEFNEFKGILGTLRTTEISGARVIDESFGPHGYIQLVESTSERTAAGLSAGTPFGIRPPAQHAVFVDGEKVGSLARGLTKDQGRFLDWLLSALPYQLTATPPAVLALQSAGGEALAEARHHGSPRVLGVTSNPAFVDLLRDHADYTGRLLEQPGVTLEVGDGRAIARAHQGEFDLVILRDLDASGLSATSTPGMSETYPLTVEAFEAYLSALRKGGMVAVTMRLGVPPHNGIRLIPTAAAALRAAGIANPADKVVFVRDTFLGLLLIRPEGFTPPQLETVRAWTRQRSFDISYLPGVRDEEVNQYTVLLEESYTNIARAVLTAPDQGAAALDAYLFNITATTDDRPYFADVVRWSTIEGLRDYQRRSMAALDASPALAPSEAAPPGVPDGDAPGVPDGDAPGVPDGDAPGVPDGDAPGVPDGDAPGVPDGDAPGVPDGDAPGVPDGDAPGVPDGGVATAVNGAPGAGPSAAANPSAQPEMPTDFWSTLQQIPVELWGAYLPWITLVQALVAALLIIAIPMLGARRGVRKVPGKLRALVYFACLGLGFMFAEMVLIRKLTLFLASPVFATTVVLAAILLFSGIGSLYSGRFASPHAAVRFAALVVVGTVAADALFLDTILRALLGLPMAARLVVAVLIIAPTAFALGFFFPSAIEPLGADPDRAALVPWAWAINGATSVIAAVLAELLAVHLGFRMVLGIVIVLYLLAWVTFPVKRPT